MGNSYPASGYRSPSTGTGTLGGGFQGPPGEFADLMKQPFKPTPAWEQRFLQQPFHKPPRSLQLPNVGRNIGRDLASLNPYLLAFNIGYTIGELLFRGRTVDTHTLPYVHFPPGVWTQVNFCVGRDRPGNYIGADSTCVGHVAVPPQTDPRRFSEWEPIPGFLLLANYRKTRHWQKPLPNPTEAQKPSQHNRPWYSPLPHKKGWPRSRPDPRWIPMVIPELLPINQPVTKPTPIPYPLIPMIHKWKRRWIPEPVPQPVPPFPPPPGHPGPPGPHVRERKFVLSIGGESIWGRVINVATESLDFLNALYGALPRAYQVNAGHAIRNADGTYRGPTPQEKLDQLYRHLDKMDLGKAFQNLVENQVEDYLFGKLGQIVAAANATRGSSAGLTLGPAL